MKKLLALMILLFLFQINLGVDEVDILLEKRQLQSWLSKLNEQMLKQSIQLGGINRPWPAYQPWNWKAGMNGKREVNKKNRKIKKAIVFI
uniref:Uncharacterized protein n=1 Tax=Acrobeloides nanus TaxID=290746 RepID=A0A914DB95_9BILA